VSVTKRNNVSINGSELDLDADPVAQASACEVHDVGGTRQLLRDLRVSSAEGISKLLAKFGPIRVSHDGRRHRDRPAEVVVGKRCQEILNLLLAEPADVGGIVNVTRRQTDHHQLGEHAGGSDRANAPIMALTECPTKTASLRSSSRPISTRSATYV
jgi:hypothetical protein